MKFSEYRGRAPNRSLFNVVFWWILVRSLCRIVFRILYRQRCLGREHVPVRGPVIYAVNHQSHYDPIIVGCVVGPFSSLARTGLFKFRPFGWLIRQLGAIPLRQDRGDAGAMRAALDELKTGGRLMIYPEGTRTRDGTVGPFRAGTMLLIRRSGATVVPVAIEGAYDVWPMARKRPRLTGRLAAAAGPPIPAQELIDLEAGAALQRLRVRIDDMRLELRRRLRDDTGGRYPAPGPGDSP